MLCEIFTNQFQLSSINYQLLKRKIKANITIKNLDQLFTYLIENK